MAMFDSLNLKHIQGPLELKPSINQAVVLCRVKDGEHLIDAFIQHYQNAGYAHIVFLDNESTDQTIQKASRYKNVTILSTDAWYGKHKFLMSFFLMRQFGVGSWFLMADIDELFVFPYSADISLQEFIHYLNQNAFTCVVAHMLDMVPLATLGQLQDKPVNSIGSADWSFNTSGITRHTYDIKENILPNDKIKVWRGGIRKLLFDWDNILTKHPFNLGDGKIVTRGAHIVEGRTIADVTGLLLHYKFVGDFVAAFKQAVEGGQYYRKSIAYQSHLEALEANPDMNFHLPSSVPYQGVAQLEELGLFETSQQYRDLC